MTEPGTDRFGLLLRDAMKRRGLTYSAAARKIGIDHSYIGRLVSGERGPSAMLIETLIDGLELTAEEGMQMSLAAGQIPERYRAKVSENVRLVEAIEVAFVRKGVPIDDRSEIERDLLLRMVADCPFELPVRKVESRDVWYTSPHDVIAWIRGYVPAKAEKTT
ncbi:MAG: helix-turn-helix transcriptional regulator [Thermomicrobiales bacterium]